jgi:hypothetical protein
MTTTHYYYDSVNYKESLESALQQNCHDLAKKHGAFLRVVKSGAGVVILPDTDRTHDCSPNELAKALHLREEIEKLSTEKTYQDLIICEEDDNRNYFVKLTEEQYRLLVWLYNESLLSSYVKYEKATPFETI